MKKLLRLLALFVCTIVAYFGALILPYIAIERGVDCLLSFIGVANEVRSMVYTVLLVVIAFILSSDWVYSLLHKLYCGQLKKKNKAVHNSVFYALISANDVIAAFPKRTLLFLHYLWMTIMDKLGFSNIDIDLLFVGVVIIGIDRVTKSWAEEKKKLFALGEKAYSDTMKIEDSVVENH